MFGGWLCIYQVIPFRFDVKYQRHLFQVLFENYDAFTDFISSRHSMLLFYTYFKYDEPNDQTISNMDFTSINVESYHLLAMKNTCTILIMNYELWIMKIVILLMIHIRK